jgi:hypothetical protein
VHAKEIPTVVEVGYMKIRAILMLIIILVSCKRGPQNAAELAQRYFKLSERAVASFPNETPRMVDIFEFKELSIGKQSVINLQERFGFKPAKAEVKESPSHFWVQNGNWYFEVSKFSGQELVANLDKYRKQLQGLRWSIEEEKLKAIAKEFILTRAFVNMKEVVEEPIVRYTTASVGETKDTIKVDEDFIEADVIFTRRINGIPVIGPGSKLVVTISADGSVSGFYKIWREIDYAVKRPKIKTTSSLEAIEKLMHKTMQFKQSRNGNYCQVDIAAFGYWASPRHWQQKTLLPAHTFVYSMRDEKGTVLSKAREELMEAYEGAKIDRLGGFDALKETRKPIEPDKRVSIEGRRKTEREKEPSEKR